MRGWFEVLGAFLQHSDNKPPQQRLACDKVHVDEKTQPFTTTCDKPVMLVQMWVRRSVGGGMFTSNGSAKMNLQVWSAKSFGNKLDGRCAAAVPAG